MAKSTTKKMKRWVGSGSKNSRHPQLNGETVDLFQPFSNGLQYPGDHRGPESEWGGCQCHLEIVVVDKKTGAESDIQVLEHGVNPFNVDPAKVSVKPLEGQLASMGDLVEFQGKKYRVLGKETSYTYDKAGKQTAKDILFIGEDDGSFLVDFKRPAEELKVLERAKPYEPKAPKTLADLTTGDDALYQGDRVHIYGVSKNGRLYIEGEPYVSARYVTRSELEMVPTAGELSEGQIIRYQSQAWEVVRVREDSYSIVRLGDKYEESEIVVFKGDTKIIELSEEDQKIELERASLALEERQIGESLNFQFGKSFLPEEINVDQWAKSGYSKWGKGLTESEREALSAYTGDDYQLINGWLRGTLDKELTGEELTKVQDLVKNLDSSLGKAAVPEDITVYRVGSIDVPGLQIGDVYVDKGYTSTALDANNSVFVAEAVDTGMPVVRIQVPAGSRAAPPDFWGGVSVGQESELTLASNTQFQYLGVDADGIQVIKVINSDADLLDLSTRKKFTPNPGKKLTQEELDSLDLVTPLPPTEIDFSMGEFVGAQDSPVNAWLNGTLPKEIDPTKADLIDKYIGAKREYRGVGNIQIEVAKDIRTGTVLTDEELATQLEWDKLLEESPTIGREMTVYRGVGDWDAFSAANGDLKVGDVFVDDAMSSTTGNREFADYFSRVRNGGDTENTALFEIELSADQKALWTQRYYEKPIQEAINAQELVLPRGTKFKINNITKDAKGQTIVKISVDPTAAVAKDPFDLWWKPKRGFVDEKGEPFLIGDVVDTPGFGRGKIAYMEEDTGRLGVKYRDGFSTSFRDYSQVTRPSGWKREAEKKLESDAAKKKLKEAYAKQAETAAKKRLEFDQKFGHITGKEVTIRDLFQPVKLTKKVGQSVEEGLTAVDNVMALPKNMPKLEVRMAEGSEPSGFVSSAVTTPDGFGGMVTEKEQYIRLASGAGPDELVHEIGHVLKDELQLVTNKEIKQILSEVKQTGSFRSITDAYFRQDSEVWARTYEQWVATRSGSVAMREAERKFAEAGYGYLTDEEFSKVAQLMDDLMGSKVELRLEVDAIKSTPYSSYSEVQSEFTAHLDSLSPTQVEAINEYVSSESFSLNASLRGKGKKPSEFSKLVGDLDESMKPLDREATLFRGFDQPYEELFGRPPKVGDVFKDEGFTSTSLEKKVAGDFSLEGQGLLIEIRSPSGIRAIITPGPEAEVLLGRGTSFKVEEVLNDRVVVRIVDQQATPIKELSKKKLGQPVKKEAVAKEAPQAPIHEKLRVAPDTKVPTESYYESVTRAGQKLPEEWQGSNRIKIRPTSSVSSSEDMGYFDVDSKTISINTGRTVEETLQTVTHEMAHAMDSTWAAARGLGRYDSFVSLDPVAKEFFDAAISTERIQALLVERNGYIERANELLAKDKLTAADKEELQNLLFLQGNEGIGYLLDAKEVWARAYTQYTAETAGNEALLASVRAAGNSGVELHWAEEDFRQLRIATENLLKRQGILEGELTPLNIKPKLPKVPELNLATYKELQDFQVSVLTKGEAITLQETTTQQLKALKRGFELKQEFLMTPPRGVGVEARDQRYYDLVVRELGKRGVQ